MDTTNTTNNTTVTTTVNVNALEVSTAPAVVAPVAKSANWLEQFDKLEKYVTTHNMFPTEESDRDLALWVAE